jgi:hypothetical protein
MGLMQVMPQTFDMLRARYGLGDDPYEPHDNILAGAAYIREMYDRYGAPGFLAAYNAGPDRLDAWLTDGTPLPDETVTYLSSVTPRLGSGVALRGPLAVYAGSGSSAPGAADRAWSGGGLVTPEAPTGEMQGRVTEVAALPTGGDWAVQVGAFPDPNVSMAVLARARAAATMLVGAEGAVLPVQRGQVLYRARLTGLSAQDAASACAMLANVGMDCFTVPPGS